MTIVGVVLIPTWRHSILALTLTSIRLRRAHDDTVICVGLDMLLEILRTLEGLSTEFTLVRLQRNVDSNVGGDVVTLDGSGAALTPSASQVEVVGGLAADVTLADMLL
jgi:hypothetical protein